MYRVHVLLDAPYRVLHKSSAHHDLLIQRTMDLDDRFLIVCLEIDVGLLTYGNTADPLSDSNEKQ